MNKYNYLKLMFDNDTDGTGELFAEFQANGFSGVGSAWFNASEVNLFAKSLMAYPLSSKQEIKIEGGYWGEKGDDGLEQIQLSIKVYVISSRGVIGVKVLVAQPIHYNDSQKALHSAQGEIITNYNDLEQFAKQIEMVINGSRNFAQLEAITA